MKILVILMLATSAFAFGDMEPMRPFKPLKPIVFKPMKDPAKYPEGISFTCEESNQQYLLFRNEKRTTVNGVQFQSQSILTFETEQECLHQADELNESAKNAPENTNQSQHQQ